MYVSLLLPFPGLERGKKYIYFGLNKITEHLCWDNYCYTGSVWQWKWRHLTLSWRALFNLLPACKSDCLPGRGFFFFPIWDCRALFARNIGFSEGTSEPIFSFHFLFLCLYLSCIFDHSFHLLKKGPISFWDFDCIYKHWHYSSALHHFLDMLTWL